MSKNRDYITEILSIKGRLLSETDRFNQLAARSSSMWAAFGHIKEVVDEPIYKSELLKYFPIGFVACVEGYFRLLYRDLIDHGQPYSDNIKTLKNINFSIELVLAIHSKRAVSLGEFISHLFSCNNLDDINRNMSTIIGEDFLERLINTKMRLDGDIRPSLKECNLQPELFTNLRTLFELRHIYSHELAPVEQIDPKIAEDCANAAMILIITTEMLAKDLIPERAT